MDGGRRRRRRRRRRCRGRRWELKLDLGGLWLGIVGNICLTLLFFPVARGSSVLPFFGLTSEGSIKYHIWLGHMVLIFFTSHGICYIAHWSITHQMSEVIIKMRPPTGDGSNSRIWRHERNGKYSVRSAYRVAAESIGALNIFHKDGPWERLWSLAIPPKSKHMLWKMAHGILTTRQALQRRGMNVDIRCGTCANAPETLEHVFFMCPVAVDCWNLCGIHIWVEGLEGYGSNCKQWVFALVNSGATYLIQQAAATLWAIWRERNERVWQRKSCTGEAIIRRSMVERNEWLATQKPDARQQPARVMECPNWHPPDADKIKCNTDIAVFTDGGQFG
ncbi:Ferric reduction oxidase 2, partial [Linum perenne]